MCKVKRDYYELVNSNRKLKGRFITMEFSLLSPNDFNYLSILNRKRYDKTLTDSDKKQYQKFFDNKVKKFNQHLTDAYQYLVDSIVPSNIDTMIDTLNDLVEKAYTIDTSDDVSEDYQHDINEVKNLISNHKLLIKIKECIESPIA